MKGVLDRASLPFRHLSKNPFDLLILAFFFLLAVKAAPRLVEAFDKSSVWGADTDSHLSLGAVNVPFVMTVISMAWGCSIAFLGYNFVASKVSKVKAVQWAILTVVFGASVVATHDLPVLHLLAIMAYYVLFVVFASRVTSVHGAVGDVKTTAREWWLANLSRCIAYSVLVTLVLLILWRGRPVDLTTHVTLHDVAGFVAGAVSFEVFLGSSIYLVAGGSAFEALVRDE